MKPWRRVVGLLVVFVFLAGCAAAGGGGYQSAPESEASGVPSSFYNNNPQLEQWYTAPYWMPDVGP